MAELDFENFSVEKERSEQIRNQVARLREQGWVETLMLVAQELGAMEQVEAELPGFESESVAARIYRTAETHANPGIELRLEGKDLKLRQDKTSLLEISALPKEGEFVVFFVNENEWDRLVKVMETLSAEATAAKKAKSERQAMFRAKFKASEKAEEKAEAVAPESDTSANS